MSSSRNSRRSSEGDPTPKARHGPGCSGSAAWRGGMRARAVLIVDHDGCKVLGPRFVRLLAEIHSRGSVSQATLAVGLGYRHALSWIRRAESVLDRPLVIRRAGGAAGGGSGITAEGLKLICSYGQVSASLERIVRRADHSIFGGTSPTQRRVERSGKANVQTAVERQR